MWVPFPRVPANTALISYWLGAESAYAWVVVADQIHWTRLSSPEEHTGLAQRVSPFAEPDRRHPVGPRMQDSRALSGRVLAPIERGS